MNTKLLNKNTFLWFVFAMFVALTLFVCFHHEPWSDEAQAWMIAKDASLSNIFFNVCKYEGHPIGWFFILKVFIKAGLPYEYIFVVSSLFTYLGVWLLLFKTDLPVWVKTLFPFTYYPFYQYCVVARNYSLILPVFVGIGILYKKRFEHPLLYCLLLFASALIHLYTMFIAGCFLLLFFIDIFRDKKINKKILVFPALTTFLIVLLVYYLFPPKDVVTMFPVINSYVFIRHKLYLMPFFVFANAMYISIQNFVKLHILLKYLFLAVYLILTFVVYKLSKEWCKFVLITLSLCILVYAITFSPWHAGIITYTTLLLIWIFVYEGEKYKNAQSIYKKMLTSLLVICFLIQICFSVQTSIYDYDGKYSSAKDAAEFIKSLEPIEGKIYGVDYKSVAVSPYFERKIFDNYKTATFWMWKEGANLTYEETVNSLPEVVVLSGSSLDFRTSEMYNLQDVLKEKEYEMTMFSATMWIKNYYWEDNSFAVYVKKERDK